MDPLVNSSNVCCHWNRRHLKNSMARLQLKVTKVKPRNICKLPKNTAPNVTIKKSRSIHDGLLGWMTWCM